MRFLPILPLMFATPAFAAVGDFCAINSSNIVVGCYKLDPQVYPAQPGTTYVPGRAGEGMIYDPNTQTFSLPPLTPEQQATKDAADAQQARESELKALSDVQDLANRLKTATPAQIDTWVDSNVNNVAQARTLFKAILKLLAYSLRP